MWPTEKLQLLMRLTKGTQRCKKKKKNKSLRACPSSHQWNQRRRPSPLPKKALLQEVKSLRQPHLRRKLPSNQLLPRNHRLLRHPKNLVEFSLDVAVVGNLLQLKRAHRRSSLKRTKRRCLSQSRSPHLSANPKVKALVHSRTVGTGTMQQPRWLTRTRRAKRTNNRGRSTATNARTAAMSCAARTVPKWPITSASGSSPHPKVTGGARIAPPRRPQLHRRSSSLRVME